MFFIRLSDSNFIDNACHSPPPVDNAMANLRTIFSDIDLKCRAREFNEAICVH